jgi:hypothetical protein
MHVVHNLLFFRKRIISWTEEQILTNLSNEDKDEIENVKAFLYLLEHNFLEKHRGRFPVLHMEKVFRQSFKQQSCLFFNVPA